MSQRAIFSCITCLYILIIKDRVCRFCGILRKIGIVQELNAHFWNAIHQIEGNYLLYNMNRKILYPNLNF